MEVLLLVQFRDDSGRTRAARVVDGGAALEALNADQGVYGIAMEAAERGKPIAEIVSARASGEKLDYAALIEAGRILSPIHHPDSAHCVISGTGLTHMASASSRDAMHAAAAAGTETDSMRMYRIGLEGGRPDGEVVGAPPEWFYKGDGSIVSAPGADLVMPGFAEDGGEEVEIAGVYVIRSDGAPMRLGFALGNEFSDHKIERQNYLYLAHSKLRVCSFGPEILVGDLPADVRGQAVIMRGNETVWLKDFATGEANMCHSIANLEHHHFKYAQFRHPGDVHIHYFGAAAVSCADGVETQSGDVFEISAAPFTRPLRNRLQATPKSGRIEVQALYGRSATQPEAPGR